MVGAGNIDCFATDEPSGASASQEVEKRPAPSWWMSLQPATSLSRRCERGSGGTSPWHASQSH